MFATLTKPFYTFMRWIDNGEFFRKPLQWLYIVCGILSFCLSIGTLYAFYEGVAKPVAKAVNGWHSAAFWITAVVVAIVVIIFALYCFLFWYSRYKTLNQAFKKGDKIVALPIWGHWVQTTIEFWGLFLAAVPTIYLIGTFTYWFVSFKAKYFQEFGHVISRNDTVSYIIGLLAVIIIFIIMLLVIWSIAYIILLLGHVIGEKIRIKANIANDTRDMGDILRGTVIKEDNN